MGAGGAHPVALVQQLQYTGGGARVLGKTGRGQPPTRWCMTRGLDPLHACVERSERYVSLRTLSECLELALQAP